ncbi:MAG: hypothetical protein IPK76_02760 [Lewinellaceae bacterium]|nr:hypothetical protein [Lewinellaceae bacterium]
MLRILFAAILLLHGLIHLMGFAKAFKYAEINQLQLPVSRPTGSFWLLASLIFVISTILFLLKKDTWWMFALPAILISQALVFRFWQDAKFGSIANIIILLGVALAWGGWSFNRMVEKEKQAFLPRPNEQIQTILTREMLAGLPPIVQSWLERSNSIGKPFAQTVHLQQQGEMRTSPDGKWMTFEAQQIIQVPEPGFIWTVCVQAAPFVELTGRDKYEAGKGYMLIKALSLITVADASGPKPTRAPCCGILAADLASRRCIVGVHSMGSPG